MNKKKKILLLASVGAAFAIIGGTVAAYVITDNANPIGSKISPTEIHDDETGNITLTWGTNSIANVENLKVGQTAKVGNVSLVATGDDGNGAITSYTGVLDVKLTDLTVYGDSTPAHKLIDYLEVDVYAGNQTSVPEEGEPVGHIPPAGGGYSTSITASGTPDGSVYSIFVTLSEDARECYTEISSHVVYIQFDWNKNKSDENLAKTTTVYFDAPNDWTAPMYVYAFDSVTSAQNDAWPGKQMSVVGKGRYSYELPGNSTTKTFDLLVFSDSSGKQTTNVALDYTKPYHVCGAAGEDGKFACTAQSNEPVLLANYYVTGKIKGIDNWFTTVGFVDALKMSDYEGNKGKLANIELLEGDQLLVIGKDGKYYHTKDGGDWAITEDGVYDIYLNNEDQVWAVKVGEIPAQD